MSVEEDIDRAKKSSAQMVAEVDSRIQNAKGAVYDLAKAIAEIEGPDPNPPTPLINPKRMAFRHKKSPDAFPFMALYKWFSENVELFENVDEHNPNKSGRSLPLTRLAIQRKLNRSVHF